MSDDRPAVTTVGDYLREEHPDVDATIAPRDPEPEGDLAEEFSHLGVDPPDDYPYRRYDSPVTNVVERKFLHDWLCDYGREDLFGGTGAKLFNSGMSALSTLFVGLAAADEYGLVYPEHVYYETDDLVAEIARFFGETTEVDAVTGDSVRDAVDRLSAPAIVLLETVPNAKDMPFIDEEVVDRAAEHSEYVVVDNTMLGAPRFPPDVLGRDNVLYVESMTKYYHRRSSSFLSAGSAVYPDHFETLVLDNRSQLGTYLQTNDLLDLPFQLYDVGKENLRTIGRVGQEFYEVVRRLGERDDCAVSVGDVEPGPSQFPPVLFVEFEDNQTLAEYIDATGLDDRSSFGHRKTAIAPIGPVHDDAPDGLCRISFGFDPDLANLLADTRRFFGV